ncbi:MAG TPA: alpha/beta hydrolase [Rhizomicrobium sp.]|nr:alpha/beta hydrolase [Rhizomicrobium sp.]
MANLNGSPTLIRRALRVGLIVAAVVLVLAATALGYRAWRQHENALVLAVDPKTGVAETMFVSLGGIPQWIQIRSNDRKNPVLLFVHGGPGSPVSPISSLMRTWEKYFTVVMWDQRDAGKTFVRNGPVREMSLPRVAQDGIELAQFLCRHLGKRKIIVLGHSWGTMVGLEMVVQRPDLFSAYVGTGQVVSIAEKESVIYARTMARLRATHDEDGIDKLAAIGTPPYPSEVQMRVERSLSERSDIPSERDLLRNMIPIALVAPNWSLWDIYESLQASDYAEDATFSANASYDAKKFATDIRLPFFIINGALDHITPTDLAKHYFDQVRAPAKQFVVLNGAGHSAVLTEPDVFLHELVTRVRPVTMTAAGETK